MPIVQIPVIKGGKGAVISVDTDKDIPDDVFSEIVLLGLKVLLNRGTSKITKTTYPVAEELQAAASAKAEEQLELVKTSKIKFSGTKKAKGVGGAVMTEARRIAKNIVKDEIKKAGQKISHYEASEITKAANALLESETGAGIIEQAKANLAEREQVKVSLDIAGLIKPSAKKVAAAEAKKKEKAPLSAKQAGKTAKRAKGDKKAPAQAPTA